MEFLTATLSLFVIFCMTVTMPAIWRYLFVMYKLKNIPSPKGLPLLGNLLQLGTSNSSFFQTLGKWADKFREKGCFVIYAGVKPMVVINNAADAEVALCSVKQESRGFDFIIRSWLNDGVAISKGPKWAFRRKLLTPSFHFSILSKFLVVFNEQAKQLTHKLCGMVNEKQVDIQEVVTLCTLDIACETLMGLRLGAQMGHGTEYINAVKRQASIVIERMTKPWLWNDAVYRRVALGKEEQACLKVLHGTTKKVIRERKKELENVKDLIIHDMSKDVRNRRRLALLDLLIEAQKQNNSLTDEGIQEEVDTFMFAESIEELKMELIIRVCFSAWQGHWQKDIPHADGVQAGRGFFSTHNQHVDFGHDTVSSSATFALYLIGRHPEVQRKVHEELDRVFGSDLERPVSLEDIQKLQYLNCVMKESLRLLPSAPSVFRELGEDIEACGATIPRGTAILVNLFWLHRDPKQFPDPEKFDPGRFLPDNSKDRHNFAYLPFGAGPRNCIGQKFAMMEEKVILATVLRKLSVTSFQKIEDLGLFFALVLRSLDTINVSLSLRKTS